MCAAMALELERQTSEQLSDEEDVGPMQASVVHYQQRKQRPSNTAARPRVAQFTSALEAISLQATAAGHAGSANSEVPIPYAMHSQLLVM